MTRREAQILEAVRERLTNAEIAARFFISERTVESHVSSLLRKLQVPHRMALAELAPPAPTSAPPDEHLPGGVDVLTSGPLVGRRDELHRLERLWSRARSGHAALAVVTGEAGVGKSRLAAELAAMVHRSGGTVLWGACGEDVQAPYQPFADALERHARALTSAPLAAELGRSGVALAQVLGLADPPALHQQMGPAVGPEIAASELWSALRRYLGWLGTKAPLVFVVEDLHWAAESTREVLLHLARSASTVPLLLLATSRDSPPDVDRAGEVFLGRCELLPNSERIALEGFDRRLVGELLSSLGSDADAHQVCEETGGIPLLVRELARSAESRASSLDALLAPRYARLDPEVQHVLDAASVLGATFDSTRVARVVDRPVMDVVRALDAAEAAGLVASIPDRPGRYSFVHPLFRTLHYGRLSTHTRLELHHLAALDLEAAASDRRDRAALARHSCLAAPVGDPRAAIRYACEAAVAAEQVLALDEAAQHYRQALEVADLLPNDRPLRMQLTIWLGEVLVGAGDPSGRELLVQAATSARELADGVAMHARELVGPPPRRFT